MSGGELDFVEQVRAICRDDERYALEAYLFVYEALGYTVKVVAKGVQRHVDGHELLEGIRLFCLERFGPLTLMVFDQWGITRSEDFGEIVFNLVEQGLMGKTQNDTREDFSGWRDFKEVFGRELKLEIDPSWLHRNRPGMPAWKWSGGTAGAD